MHVRPYSLLSGLPHSDRHEGINQAILKEGLGAGWMKNPADCRSVFTMIQMGGEGPARAVFQCSKLFAGVTAFPLYLLCPAIAGVSHD